MLLARICAAGSFCVTVLCVLRLREILAQTQGGFDVIMRGAGLGLVGCGSALLGMVLISRALTHALLSPLLWFIEGKMRPESWVKRRLDYRLARFYASQGRHADAIEEYLRIVEDYPLEEQAYLEGIHQACLHRDPAGAEALCRRWRRALPRIEAARDREVEGAVPANTHGREHCPRD